MESDDPTVVRSVAVAAEDIVAALESSRRSGRDAVLRLTPPFSGRMRARLHVESGAEAYHEEPTPVHVDPEALVAASAPDYPTPAETGDELRADPDETYTHERHRERHAEAVEEWRSAVTDHVAERLTLPTADGPHEVAVTLLG